MTYRFPTILLLFCLSIIAESTQECSSQADSPRIDPTSNHESCPISSCFRVATLLLNAAHGDRCHENVKVNLRKLEKAAAVASREGARLLLAPEDGLLYSSEEELLKCLEDIPDPETLDKDQIPCLDSSSSSPILTRLSCMARQYNLYLVANYPTRHSCNTNGSPSEETCPLRGFYMLNTNVVLDPSGRFIKRYHKYNIFGETEIFDKAPNLEHVYFDTEHGRLGIFTCFDLIFHRPAVELVERYKIDTVLFPTWWFDEIPMLTTLQYQDGWSLAHGVNFVSANLLRPSVGSVGSAIFSNNQTFSIPQASNKSQILIANIEKPNSSDCSGKYNPIMQDIDDDSRADSYAHKHTQLLQGDSLVILDGKQTELTVCNHRVCCQIAVSFSRIFETDRKLALIVRDSPRTGFYGWHEQFCTIATVARFKSDKKGDDNEERSYTGLVFDSYPAYKFQKLKIKFNTTTKYVYPIAGQDSSTLIGRDRRVFRTSNHHLGDCKDNCRYLSEHKLIATNNEETPIYSFGLYGRVYEGDNEPKKVTPKPYVSFRSDL